MAADERPRTRVITADGELHEGTLSTHEQVTVWGREELPRHSIGGEPPDRYGAVKDQEGRMARRVVTEEDRVRVVALFREGGLARSELAATVGWSKTTVTRILREAGHGHGPCPRVPPELKARFLVERRAGQSAYRIARTHGVGETTVLRTLHQSGVPPRPVGARKYSLNEAAFDVGTDAAAYWAGFIFADGCVLPHRNRLYVSAHERDAGHLRALLAFLGSDQPLSVSKSRPMVAVSVHSHHLVEALRRLGIEPRKSTGRPRAASWLASRSAFWAGMVDGDGWVGQRRRSTGRVPIVVLYGSPVLLGQFRSFLIARVYKPAWRVPGVVRHERSLFRVTAIGSRAERVLRTLEESPIRLHRKAALGRALVEGAVAQRETS